jgi:hypothetical protein
MVYESVSFTSQIVAQDQNLKVDQMKTEEQKTLEDIARAFQCADVNDLNDVETDIVMILTEAGYIGMDKVYTEDGDYMYSELYATLDE